MQLKNAKQETIASDQEKSLSSEYCMLIMCHFITEEFWRRWWHPTPVFLPGKSHGQRSLVGCSPWGHEESDTTERLHFHFSLSRIGEGNGNPLQCSCLENPRDGGTWWAAVYGVAQSRTRLKRFSSSSRSSSVYMSIPISQSIPPCLPLVTISLFSTSVTLFLFCK